MAKSWRDFAGSPRDDSDNRDISLPIVANVTNVTPTPPVIAEGLVRFRSMAVPSWCDPERWAVIRTDIERLTREGWVGQAIDFGWQPLDLFGLSLHGNAWADGLAIWLDGRKLRALSNDFAVVVDCGGGRSYFNLRRPRPPGARLLWELGQADVAPLKGAGLNGR